MPEIKNQFTGGKMNKDVDERLVPKGEYRNAMNIQVSTSEGSDVGTVQNILGNKLINGLDFLSSDATCVGVIADEKNDALYWLVAEHTTNSTGNNINSKNLILQYKSGVVTPVFVDEVGEVEIYGGAGMFVMGPTADTTIMNLDPTDPGLLELVPSAYIHEVIMDLNNDGNYSPLQLQGSVISVNYATGAVVLDVNFTELLTEVFGGQIQQTEFYALSATVSVLGFDKDNIITGINIIDDMLFWTDGVTEPKKINIPRSIEGTAPSGMSRTRLINEAQGINYASDILIEEEHITVVKKAPLRAPYLKMRTSRGGDSRGTTSYNFNGVSPSDTITISIQPFSSSSLNYQVNDVLLLKQINNPVGSNFPVTEFDIRAVVIGISASNAIIQVLSITSNIAFGSLSFIVDLDKFYDKLYALKFPRFAYRYKYEDNEYSSIGPFSEVAFQPGVFDFSPNKGYNLGMENKLRELTIRKLIPRNIPMDVVEVDILYKESNSPNIYIVDEIKPSDPQWDADNYKITSETIKAAVSSNQLLRAWDNVPKKASAQEVTGNRIVYGNYEQNYDMHAYRPSLDVTLLQRAPLSNGGWGVNSFLKTIKSLRDYQVGVVFSDAYGRQTPVLTDSTGSIKVSKLAASKSNQIELQTNTPPPGWAKYQKFYIKETSTEYYNLSLDKYFEAKDGNIWLSFPSSDRNKVDLDSSLYLKKSYNSAEAGFSTEKYKVIDINNEAPEFIKTRRSILGKIDNGADNILFTVDKSLPVRYEDEFTVESSPLTNTILENFHKRHNSADSGVGGIGGGAVVNNPLFVRITSYTSDGVGVYAPGSLATNWYEIDNVKKSVANAEYIIRVKEPFGLDATWTNTGASGNLASGMSTITNDEVGLQLEIGQDTVQNKALFQGRFFVKILMDTAVEDNIIAPAMYQTVEVLATARCGYLKDFTQEDLGLTNTSGTLSAHAAAISDFNVNGPDGNPGNYGVPEPDGVPVPTDSYWSWRAWNKIQDKLNTLESRWVIDEAFATGEEPFWGSAGYVDYNEQADVMWGSYSTTYGGYHSQSAPIWTMDHNSTSGSWNPSGMASNLVQGLGHNTNIEDYEYFTVGSGVTDHTIDISYIGTGRASNINISGIYEDVNASASDLAFISTAQMIWSTWWEISGASTGDALDDEARVFADMLQPGAFIRFTNDPNLIVYEIQSVKKIFKLNYAEGKDDNEYPFASSEIGGVTVDGWPNGAAEYFNRSHFNRRITYRLQLIAPNAGDVIGTNGGNVGVGYDPLFGDNTNETNISGVFCPIEIVTLHDISTAGETTMPEDPAVFETVPKEDTGLDIYHEASDTMPIDLAFDPNAFAPPGTRVSTPNDTYGANAISGVATVAKWEGNLLKISNSFFIEDNLQQGQLLTFTRPDGSYTTAIMQGGLGELISGQPDSSYYAYIDQVVGNNKIGIGWHNCYAFGNGVESNRIRDTFNLPFIDNGPKASSTLEGGYEKEQRKYGLIYSGIYNSTSGINNLNQFIAAEKITKDINPIYGSIQKLYAGWGQGGDLIALCEDRVLKILANKNALYNADGNTNVTSTNNVLGQAIPYSGEYGISKNPESFASEAYRIYFTDKVRGTVMRLSMDGLTPISNHGMKDWFRDKLKLGDKLIGSYDDKKDEYNITIKGYTIDRTVTFKEDVKGWVSFKSFTPENAISCANEYYTFKDGKMWKHHDESVGRNTFYGASNNWSTLKVILNDMPGSVKSFNTINYEGSQSKVDQLLTDGEYHNLHAKTGWYVNSISTNKETGTINEFIEKEGKWFNYIKGQNIQHAGQHILMNTDGGSTFDQASFAIQGIGTLSITPIITLIEGCTDVNASNYDSGAQIDDGSCIPFTHGCMDSTASNFNSTVSSDDGSCLWFGCTINDGSQLNPTQFPAIAFSYSASNSIIDDGSCIPIIYGCTDLTALNYNSAANTNATSASDATDPCIAYSYGCMISLSDNFDPLANTDDGTCTWLGCTNTLATNYGWFGWGQGGGGTGFPALTSSYAVAGSQYGVQNNAAACMGGGCMDPTANNYDAAATYDPLNTNAPDYFATDGSCVYCQLTTPDGMNYDGIPVVSTDVADETTAGAVDGQIAVVINQYAPYLPFTYVLTDSMGNTAFSQTSGTWLNNVSNPDSTVFINLPPEVYSVTIYGNGPGSACSETYTGIVVTTAAAPINYGCTNSLACNYNFPADATHVDDNSCEFITCAGCTNPLANYPNPSWGNGAGTSYQTQTSGPFQDNVQCIIPGTTTAGPCTITCGDGVYGGGGGSNWCCGYTIPGCTDPTACNYASAPNNQTIIDGSMPCNYSGCTDATANNYLPCATIDDGSCTYTVISGCTDPAACNYDQFTTTDDGSCILGFAGVTIGDPVFAAANNLALPFYYHDNGTAFPQLGDTIQNMVIGGYPADTLNDVDVALSIRSLDPTMAQYSSGDSVKFQLREASNGPPPTNFNSIVDGPITISNTGPIVWNHQAGGAVFGDRTNNPTLYADPYPWGPGAADSQNYTFDYKHVVSSGFAMVKKFVVEVWSEIGGVEYGKKNGLTPSCGVYQEFVFEGYSQCSSPFANSGCTNPAACNYDYTANCDDGSCYFGTVGGFDCVNSGPPYFSNNCVAVSCGTPQFSSLNDCMNSCGTN